MTRSMLLLAAFAIAVTTPAPAQAQSLAERIAVVRKQHETAHAEKRDPKILVLQKLLYRELDVDFDQTPAHEVFDFLRTVLDINLIVRSQDDPVGHGIDPETPVTLKGEDMLALDVLELTLEQVATLEPVTWQLRRSFLEVGTKERLGVEAAQDLRIYPIDDLLFEPPRYDNAIPMGFGYGYPGWVNAYDNYATGVRPGGGVRYYPPGPNNPPLGVGGYPGSYGGGMFGGGASGSFGPGVATRGGVGASNSTLNGPAAQSDRARDLIGFLTDTIEPGAWVRNGGTQASISYREGSLVVRAPDYIQRQIGGYPRVPAPKATEPAAE